METPTAVGDKPWGTAADLPPWSPVNPAGTIGAAECADVYERLERSPSATARALGISESTVRRRLADYYGGVQQIPAAKLRSSSAAIGRAFEHRVRDDLTTRGWWVIRAAGSKGIADLVALRAWGSIALVSVKRGGSVPVGEWNALYELARRLVPALAIVALMPRGGGVEYRRITAPKDGSRRRQPWHPWEEQ